MNSSLGNLMNSLSAGLQKLMTGETPEEAASRESLAFQQAVAVLLYEMARVDHHVKEADLRIAADALCALFALPPERAQLLLQYAAQPQNRPTSYHSLVRLINARFTAEQKRDLIEHMWRVAHADHEVDMYEDHLVRKIAELLYVPHSEFIAAKHRARGRS